MSPYSVLKITRCYASTLPGLLRQSTAAIENAFAFRAAFSRFDYCRSCGRSGFLFIAFALTGVVTRDPIRRILI